MLTVDDLLIELQRLKKLGYGNRKVMVSDDEECNGYHGLFYNRAELGTVTLGEEFKELGTCVQCSPKATITDFVFIG